MDDSSQPTQLKPALKSEEEEGTPPSRAVLQTPRPGQRRKISRILSFIAQELKRPSLLASSDSNDTESTPRDPFGSANQDTREAARVLGVGLNRSRRGTRDNFRRAASSTGVGTVGDEYEEKEDNGPVSIVVIDTEIEVEDDRGSAVINSNGLTRQGSGGSRTGSWVGGGVKSRTSGSDAMAGKMMSGMKAVWVMVYFFFNQSFAEKHKERVYQREVSRRPSHSLIIGHKD